MLKTLNDLLIYYNVLYWKMQYNILQYIAIYYIACSSFYKINLHSLKLSYFV